MAPQNPRPLCLSDSYPCPICQQGSIEAIVLTEAFACEFCRHILSANLPAQQVQVVDSSQPLTWLWNGQHWKLERAHTGELSGLVLLTAVVLVIIPASVVWVAGAIFPPLAPAPTIPFSTLWAGITLLAHLIFVLWLVGEYYQIPFYVTAKLRVLRVQGWRRNE